MHKKLPNIFIFLDQYNSQIFKNKNINIGIFTEIIMIKIEKTN